LESFAATPLSSNEEQHQLKKLKGVAAKESDEEQHQLKELKGVAGKDSNEERHQLKQLKGRAAKDSNVEYQRHLAFACYYTWEMGSKKKSGHFLKSQL
jgi:hypothetical protein